MYYLDPKIDQLHRIFDQNGRSGYLRLDLNENPKGLPENFIKNVLSDITPEQIAQYPETQKFQELLASYLEADVNQLCLVNGSSEGIRYIIEAFTSPGGKIVGVVPSYFMFQIYSEMYGREFVKVPYNDDLSMDISNIIAEMTEDTQLVILLNPNNPMGNVYSDEEFETIFNAAQERRITMLVDEAYHYFYPKTFINYAINNDHVFITRTFSKLFSMAGCRLGYVVGWPEGIKAVQKMCTPHNTNVFALRLAEAIIENPKIIEVLIKDFSEGRSFLIQRLEEEGYSYKGDAGNFIFVKPKTNAEMIVNKMKEQKQILIKAYPSVGDLGDCLRVSIGDKQCMKIFIDALLELDN